MTRKELINYCLGYAQVYEDYPFEDANWTAIRHRTNKKTFAFIYMREGCLQINLKCEPMRAQFLRQMIHQVTPAYHMNKTHWNTVTPDGDLDTLQLHDMILHSYTLTKPRKK